MLVVAVAVASRLMTVLVRRYALSRGVLDVPNERSSHSTPTPRGGGLAIALTVLGGTVVAAGMGWVPAGLAAAAVGGGALMAVTGWIDDRRGLSALARLLVQVAAAVWAVAWTGAPDALSLGAAAVPIGAGGALLAVVGIVWATNLFNFMDGIDGLAAGQSVIAAAVAGALLLRAGTGGAALLALLVAAGAAGFLPANWSPARIFMGDVGSALLGFLFGVLAVASDVARAMPLLGWVLLLGVFVFDATVTLLRRVARGERWYAAHRSHAYQRLVQSGWTHRRTTTAALTLSIALGLLTAAAALRPTALPAALAVGAALVTAAYVAVERRLPMGGRRPPKRPAVALVADGDEASSLSS